MNSQQQRLVRGLTAMYRSGHLTDVTLMAEDHQLDCHRNVLAATCPYFKAMFGGYRESSERVVRLHDISFQALKLAVDFMYSGDVDISHDNVQCLLTAAAMLQLETLLEFCEDHMISAICVENCVDVYSLATLQCLGRLQAAAKLFILEHFCQLTPAMLQLDKLTIKDLLSSDDINVDNEEKVFDFLVKWTEHDLENRKRMFADVFQKIRLLLMDDGCLSERVETSPLVAGNPFCRATVSVSRLCRIAVNRVDTDEEKQSIVEEYELNSTRRLGMFRTAMLVFSGGANSGEQRAFSCFDPSTGKSYTCVQHHPTFDFKFKIDYYQLVTNSENQIFFIGGILFDNHHFEDDGMSLDTVYRYEPKDRRWLPVRPMNSQRAAFAACCVAERVFVFGGAVTYPQGIPQDGVEVYDPEFNLWQHLAMMPTGLVHHSATVYVDSVLIVGGKDERGDYSTGVLQYSVPHDTWTILHTDLPQPRSECRALTYENKVYILGGGTKVENMTSVLSFDPASKEWSYGQDFPDDRKFTSVALLGSRIYVCGGVRSLTSRREGRGVSRTVEIKDMYVYDLDTERWSKLAKLVHGGSHQVCTVAVINTRDLGPSEPLS